jgi:hypothetical protein
MFPLFRWLENWRKPSPPYPGRPGAKVLGLEVLEPRQLLAGDVCGCSGSSMVLPDPPDLPDTAAVVFTSWDQESIPAALADTPELVYLEDIAQQLGEAFEIDADTWWWAEDAGGEDELF